MKKIYSTLFILYIGIVCGCGQTVSFMPAWQVGETHLYSFSKVKSNYKMVDNTATLASSDTSEKILVRFEVLEAEIDHYKIKMTKEIDALLELIDSSDILYLPKEYKNIDIIFTTTRDGQITGVENWEEIAHNIHLLCDSLLSNKGNAQLQAALAEIKGLYTTKENIETLELQELFLLHWLFGNEMEVGVVYPYEEVLPNAWFPNQPLRTTTLVGIDTLNTEQSLCTVKRYSNVNEKDAKKLMQNVFKTYSIFNLKEDRKELRKMKFNILDEYTFDYSTLEHLPVSIHTIRRILMGFKNESIMQIEEDIILLLE